MKKLLVLFVCLLTAVLVLASCQKGAETTAKPPVETTPSAETSEDDTAEETTTMVAPETTSPAPADTEPIYGNTKWEGDTLKILAIGNSFSVDAMTYLYDIAKAEGVKTVILGNLYIGGCTLETHYNNSKSGAKAYQYFKNTRGTWVERPNATLLDGILDEDWDIITMQQASGSSGQRSTYVPYLKPLATFVEENMTNPDCQFAWHMTWAYQQNSTHGEFSKYRKDQSYMYQSICSAVKTYVLSLDTFPILLPAGTAIQNARTGFYGDTLTRDGYHLNETARYIAGYTWYATLTGKLLTSLALKPEQLDINETAEKLIVDAVNGALQKPFEVTPSKYTEKPTVDLSGYTKITFDYTMGGYWNSGDSTKYNRIVTEADNSAYYIATALFNRETLPVGSIIVLDEGWQYRPERWKNNAQQQNRPEPVTQEYLYVTESFWEGYTYRAFNISVIGANRSIKNDSEAITHFNIYVPQGTEIPDIDVAFPVPPSPDTFDPSNYTLLDFDYTMGGYWNSGDSNNHHKVITGADNSGYFIATEMFTRDTLPVGAVIVLDDGWQYRPEGWIDENRQTTRPGNVTEEIVFVTEEWWGNYVTRAFNIAVEGNNVSIKNNPDAITHFRIYIPKA
ncbi:MAG: DUF4886 domain-containing protein [Clostridia bacterium]|nr:DUF4886 domain-containing protein [Clostridia bacterium]